MKFTWLGAGALFLGLAIAGGCSTSSPRSESTSSTTQAIQGGTDDTAHPFAVGVCIGTPGNCTGYCSGALIAPNVVVTARHCAYQSPKVIDCTADGGLGPQFGPANPQIWITTSPDMAQGNVGWHQTVKAAVPDDNHVCGHDIALLILKAPVPSAEAKPIVPGVQYLMGDARYSSSFTAIGYGNTATTGFTAGTRRIRQNISVLCIPGDAKLPCPLWMNDNEFFGGDGTCEGDSGSSAFEQRSFDTAAASGGNGAVSFGVLSRGDDSDPVLCKSPLYTRLDKFRSLIVQAVTDASNNFTLYPRPVPDWTVYVPPPPPDAGPPPPKPPLLGIGDTCVANADCTSNLCSDSTAGKVCSLACDPSTSCPDGYTCQSGLCLWPPPPPPAPPPAVTTTTTTSGCAAARGLARPQQNGSIAAFGVAALAIAAARRRARASRARDLVRKLPSP